MDENCSKCSFDPCPLCILSILLLIIAMCHCVYQIVKYITHSRVQWGMIECSKETAGGEVANSFSQTSLACMQSY